jgi:hypothetical protein
MSIIFPQSKKIEPIEKIMFHYNRDNGFDLSYVGAIMVGSTGIVIWSIVGIILNLINFSEWKYRGESLFLISLIVVFSALYLNYILTLRNKRYLMYFKKFEKWKLWPSIFVAIIFHVFCFFTIFLGKLSQ